MRQGGIRQLRREMVHLEQGVVLLPRAKGGASPVVLNEARKILQAQLELHNKAGVFPRPEGVPYSRIHASRVFRKAARAAGLKDFHFDGPRHHGATMAFNAGFTAPIVMQLGRWKTETMIRGMRLLLIQRCGRPRRR
jgi:integrase